MILLLIMGLFHIKGLIFLSPIIFLILVSYKMPLTFISIGKKAVLLIIMFAVVYSSQIMLEDYINEVSHSKHNARIERSIPGDIKSNDEKAKVEVLNSDTIIFEKNKNIYLSEKNYTDSDPDYINIFMRKVAYYRASLSWVKEPQTAFISTISDSSIPAFITTYLHVYIEYLIAPFIFQVNSLLSLLAYAESVLRILLIASSIIFLKRNPQISILFLIYLAITGMWALGVVSYGAAIRHHIQTNWILVLLGVPIISGYLRGMKFNGKKS